MAVLRVVLTVAVALPLAFAVVGSGLDRMSDAGEIADSAVPTPFRANASRVESTRLLEAGDARGATAAARLAVSVSPADARAVGLYGQALLTQGNRAAAKPVFAVSRELGWREPYTNLFWIDEGLQGNDLGTATDHFDALLRQTPEAPERGALLARFEATPEGRSALAARLAEGPEWRTRYFFDTALPTAGDPIARSEVARRLALKQGVRDCALVSPIVGALLHFRHGPQAQEIYRLHCAASGEPLAPADGNFVRANAGVPPTALDWRFSGEGAIGVAIVPRAGFRGRVVTVGSLSPVTMAFVTEPLTLAPGTYRLSWRAVDDNGAPSATIDGAIGCGPDDHPLTDKRLIDSRSGRYSADVTVPSGCTAPVLSFAIAAGASNISLGEVTLN